jgi:hypothetical protein
MVFRVSDQLKNVEKRFPKPRRDSSYFLHDVSFLSPHAAICFVLVFTNVWLELGIDKADYMVSNGYD